MMAEEKANTIGLFKENTVVAALRDTFLSFSERRAALGLPNPGTVDNIAREVQKDVFLTNFMFTGLRADLTKVLSVSPLFHISHAFAMGSQGQPPYAFAAMYGTPKVLIFPDIPKTRADVAQRSSFKVTWITTASLQQGQTIGGQLALKPRPILR